MIRPYPLIILAGFVVLALARPSIAEPATPQKQTDAKLPTVEVEVDVVIAPVRDVDVYGISYSYIPCRDRWSNTDGIYITTGNGRPVEAMRKELVIKGRLTASHLISIKSGSERIIDLTPDLLRRTSEASVVVSIESHTQTADRITLSLGLTASYDLAPTELRTRVSINPTVLRTIERGESIVFGGIRVRGKGQVIKPRTPHFGSRDIDPNCDELLIFLTPHLHE